MDEMVSASVAQVSLACFSLSFRLSFIIHSALTIFTWISLLLVISNGRPKAPNHCHPWHVGLCVKAGRTEQALHQHHG